MTRVSHSSRAILFGLVGLICCILLNSVVCQTWAAMPVPTGQGVSVYDPVASPVMSDDLLSAKPIGVGTVADGGDNLSLLIGAQFDGPVDLYLGLYLPAIDAQNIYIVTETGVQTLAVGLAPWKRGVTSVTQDLFGPIPVSSLPNGQCTFFLLTAPAGSLASYYLWASSVNVPADGMVPVPGGCFQMGDTFGDGYSVELPVHQVCLSGFSIDRYEVTQAEYQAVMGTNLLHSQACGGNCPVEVSWYGAHNYCRVVGKRLPTEAEWEYAARNGGQNQKYAGTSIDADLGNYAWFSDNSGGTTHPVGQKLPNGLGVYDMSGSLWEWVADWYGPYSAEQQNNPTGPSSGSRRVVRGGSRGYPPRYLRASHRSIQEPSDRFGFGFRCAGSP